MSIVDTIYGPLILSCFESEYEKVLKIANVFCLKKNVDFKIFTEVGESKSNFNTYEMAEDNDTIEEIVGKLFMKYIFVYPYSSVFHYYSTTVSKNNDKPVEIKKSIMLIMIENNETKNEKDIENTVWFTLHEMFLQMKCSRFDFDDVQTFFEIIVKTTTKLVLYKPGDRLLIENKSYIFKKYRNIYDGVLATVLPIMNSFFTRIYNFLFARSENYVQSESTSRLENEDRRFFPQKEEIYNAVFSSYVTTQNSNEVFWFLLVMVSLLLLK